MKTNSTQPNHNTRNWPLLGLAGLVLAGAIVSPAISDAPKTDAMLTQVLAAHARTGSTDVLARIAGPLTPSQQSQLTALGANVTRDLSIIHSISLSLPTRNLAKLDALPFVTHLSYDGLVKKCDQFTVASSGAGVVYAAPATYKDAAGKPLTGVGVTVAVVDSGIRYCRDLTTNTGSTRVLAALSFVPNDTNTDDLCGHGTHVAGIIGGNGAASAGSQYYRTFYGIAQGANLISARVLDANGQADVSTVIAGIQWIVNNKKTYNVRVLNLSLGHQVGESYKTDPLCQAVESAWKAGIVVVCAAGNEGRLNSVQNQPDNEGWGTAYGSIASPGNDPYVITVGATKENILKSGAMDTNRADDKIATYSSRGPTRLDLLLKPDLVAPGNRVISLYSYNSALYRYNSSANTGLLADSYQNTTWTGFSTDYFVLSGTSMASPVVAGAAALLLQKDPTLTPDTVKARLMLSADKWAAPNGSYDPLTYGAGYLDIPAALADTVTLSQSALSPALARDANGNVGIVNSSSIIWGKNVIWGKDISSLMGSSVLWGTSIIWGKNVIWSSSVASPNGAVASSSIIWGKSVWTNTGVYPMSSSSVDLSSIALNGE
jgi:serine protease AprX